MYGVALRETVAFLDVGDKLRLIQIQTAKGLRQSEQDAYDDFMRMVSGYGLKQDTFKGKRIKKKKTTGPVIFGEGYLATKTNNTEQRLYAQGTVTRPRGLTSDLVYHIYTQDQTDCSDQVIIGQVVGQGPSFLSDPTFDVVIQTSGLVIRM